MHAHSDLAENGCCTCVNALIGQKICVETPLMVLEKFLHFGQIKPPSIGLGLIELPLISRSAALYVQMLCVVGNFRAK